MKVTLLQINDTHAYLEPHHELFWYGAIPVLKTSGGYARIASIFEQIRDNSDGIVIALDNGDTFHGTFLAVNSKGEALIEPVNLLGLDAMTAHWDFAYGPKQFDKILSQLHHPMIAINCYRKDSDELAYQPYRIVERQGVRVGIIGIAATILDKTMPAHFSEGLRFTLGHEELPTHIRTLKEQEGVDLIVVLSHLGFPQDVKLAGMVEGVDAWLSGHTHNRLYKPFFVKGVPIIQSGCHGSFVGRLDLFYEKGRVIQISHELIHVDESIQENIQMKQAVDDALTAHRQFLSSEVGNSATLLHRNTMLWAPMDQLLLRAMAHEAGTRIAFSNGWRYGAPIAAGPVTENDLWNIIPSNPPIYTVELTGEEMLAMLEENLENSFAGDPYYQMGGFVKRSIGIELYIRIENPKGARIQELFVEGEPVELARYYKVAMVSTQGVPEDLGKSRAELDVHAIDALRKYLSSGATSTMEGRVEVI